MADNEQTRVCPLCAETIKAAAKVCPYCRKSQRSWIFLTRYDLCALASFLLFLAAIYFGYKITYQGRNFGSDKDKVQVSDIHFTVAKKGYETNVVVSGILTNKSEHSWEVGDFEIRYFNKKGEVFDVDKPSSVFTVLPHNDHAFNLTVYSRNVIPDFARSEVRVISATDPQAPFELFGSD